MPAIAPAINAQSNPNNQQRNVKRVNRQLSIRLSRAQNEIKRLVRGIPRKASTVVDTPLITHLRITNYEITPEERQRLAEEVHALLNEELLENEEGKDMPENWFYKSEIEIPFRQGVLTEIEETNRLIEAAIIAGILLWPGRPAIDPVNLLRSEAYRAGLEEVYVRNFLVIKGLSDSVATQIVGVINNGIDAKLSISDIAKKINERFAVSKVSSLRIAQTETNRAFNDGKINMGELAEQETGIKTAVRHISALLPTTRPHHAARHRKIYSRAAQQSWWAEGVNRINCRCTIESVLVNKKNRDTIERLWGFDQ